MFSDDREFHEISEPAQRAVALDLRERLRRVEPSPGFADAVLRRVQQVDREKSKRRAHTFRLATAAALLLALMAGAGEVVLQRQRHQQQRAEVAAEQFAVAMRVTHATLADVSNRVGRHGALRSSAE